MKNKINLNISIFYAESMWFKVLNEAIWPLVDTIENLEGCSLMLSRLRGDHIQLTLKTEKSNAKALAQKADVHLQKFLKECPSTSTRSLIPEHGPYLDFRNNSKHYGLFDCFVGRDPIAVFESYQQGLTRVLFQIFQCYGPDTLDDLVEIMIQLFTIFCNAIPLDNKEAITLFDFMLEMEYKKYKDEALKKIIKINKTNFEDNKDPIREYLSNTRKGTAHYYDEKWQNTWSRAVSSCCKPLSKTIAKDKMKDEYVFMIDSLRKTCDFKDSISAYYLFSNALKSTVL